MARLFAEAHLQPEQREDDDLRQQGDGEADGDIGDRLDQRHPPCLFHVDRRAVTQIRCCRADLKVLRSSQLPPALTVSTWPATITNTLTPLTVRPSTLQPGSLAQPYGRDVHRIAYLTTPNLSGPCLAGVVTSDCSVLSPVSSPHQRGSVMRFVRVAFFFSGNTPRRGQRHETFFNSGSFPYDGGTTQIREAWLTRFTQLSVTNTAAVSYSLLNVL